MNTLEKIIANAVITDQLTADIKAIKPLTSDTTFALIAAYNVGMARGKQEERCRRNPQRKAQEQQRKQQKIDTLIDLLEQLNVVKLTDDTNRTMSTSERGKLIDEIIADAKELERIRREKAVKADD